MCNLDVIGGDPLTQEQLWNLWLFNSLQDTDFVVTLVLFGAVFVMAVSVLVLFGVMITKHFRNKTHKPAVEPDGSVHFVPFLCSILGSIMFVFALFVLVVFVISWNHIALYMVEYSFAIWYAFAMSILFGISLYFSPQASKAFRTWNKICLIVSLLVVAAGVYFWLFLRIMNSFTEAILWSVYSMP